MTTQTDSLSPKTDFRQAFLFDVDQGSDLGAITDHAPAYLLPIAGKCLADRILGRLSDIGIEKVYIFIKEQADITANFFGDGSRWGMELELIDVRTPEQMVSRLRRAIQDKPVLTGELFHLPSLPNHFIQELYQKGTAAVVTPDGQLGGWASITAEALIDCSCTTPSEFFSKIAVHFGAILTDEPTLQCTSAAAIISSINALLSQKITGQIIPGAAGEPQLWIGAGTSIHPSAKITTPVWIGENCRIDERVKLGPYACIGDNCVLRHSSSVQNACVLPGTGIGHSLELESVIADRNYLSYADMDQTIAIPDPYLVGPNRQLELPSFLGTQLGRLFALILLLPDLFILAIVYLAGWIINRSRPITTVQCIRLPSPSDAQLWKTFTHYRWVDHPVQRWNHFVNSNFARIILAIPNIAIGRLHWVGLLPRTSQEIEDLPKDWKMLYLGSKPGLFQQTEIDQRHIGDSLFEQQFSSEAFYASTQSLKLDLAIILKTIFKSSNQEHITQGTKILSLTTSDETLDQLHNFLRNELKGKLISKTIKDAITTVIHEATTNIIRHGYAHEDENPIQLHLYNSNHRIEINLMDRGVGFDPDRIAPPDFNGTAEGGYGWYIINELSEHVTFSRINNWNILTLHFNLQTTGEKIHAN